MESWGGKEPLTAPAVALPTSVPYYSEARQLDALAHKRLFDALMTDQRSTHSWTIIGQVGSLDFAENS